jgi:UDP-N-acetyl-D-mannosaminuronic acid dehydrogenase
MVKLLESALTEAGVPLSGARIAVLGYAYLEDSDDTRNSPSRSLVAGLRELGAQPVVHDPWIHEYAGDVYEQVKGCDAAIVMVAHSAYRGMDLAQLRQALKHPILVDGRKVFDPVSARAAGFIFRAVGVSIEQ